MWADRQAHLAGLLHGLPSPVLTSPHCVGKGQSVTVAFLDEK